jgi:hypothetical protein
MKRSSLQIHQDVPIRVAIQTQVTQCVTLNNLYSRYIGEEIEKNQKIKEIAAAAAVSASIHVPIVCCVARGYQRITFSLRYSVDILRVFLYSIG